MHTVPEAAAMLKRPYRTVAHWCKVHNVGVMLGPTRGLTDADIDRLREIAATTVMGRPRKD